MSLYLNIVRVEVDQILIRGVMLEAFKLLLKWLLNLLLLLLLLDKMTF